jgi:hypothetical protein
LDRAGALRHHTPIRAELERQDDAADHAHVERQREHLQPAVEHATMHRIAGQQPRAFKRGEPGASPMVKAGKMMWELMKKAN